MNERHFRCTACGQCCTGWLPLTVPEALAHAHRFPLAMAWSPVRQGAKAFDLYARLGTTMQLGRARCAVLITPTVYIPPAHACPALGADNLCTIHEDKPLRCRTMPFFPFREEKDQLDLLVPRKGWACDVSGEAPIIYKERKIVDRSDFERERAAILAAAPALRDYAAHMLKHSAPVMALLNKAAMNPMGGRFVVSLTSFLRLQKEQDLLAFAKKQHPVLAAYEARCMQDPSLSEYTSFYRDAGAEMEWFAKRD